MPFVSDGKNGSTIDSVVQVDQSGSIKVLPNETAETDNRPELEEASPNEPFETGHSQTKCSIWPKRTVASAMPSIRNGTKELEVDPEVKIDQSGSMKISANKTAETGSHEPAKSSGNESTENSHSQWLCNIRPEKVMNFSILPICNETSDSKLGSKVQVEQSGPTKASKNKITKTHSGQSNSLILEPGIQAEQSGLIKVSQNETAETSINHGLPKLSSSEALETGLSERHCNILREQHKDASVMLADSGVSDSKVSPVIQEEQRGSMKESFEKDLETDCILLHCNLWPQKHGASDLEVESEVQVEQSDSKTVPPSKTTETEQSQPHCNMWPQRHIMDSVVPFVCNGTNDLIVGSEVQTEQSGSMTVPSSKTTETERSQSCCNRWPQKYTIFRTVPFVCNGTNDLNVDSEGHESMKDLKILAETNKTEHSQSHCNVWPLKHAMSSQAETEFQIERSDSLDNSIIETTGTDHTPKNCNIWPQKHIVSPSMPFLICNANIASSAGDEHSKTNGNDSLEIGSDEVSVEMMLDGLEQDAISVRSCSVGSIDSIARYHPNWEVTSNGHNKTNDNDSLEIGSDVDALVEVVLDGLGQDVIGVRGCGVEMNSGLVEESNSVYRYELNLEVKSNDANENNTSVTEVSKRKKSENILEKAAILSAELLAQGEKKKKVCNAVLISIPNIDILFAANVCTESSKRKWTKKRMKEGRMWVETAVNAAYFVLESRGSVSRATAAAYCILLPKSREKYALIFNKNNLKVTLARAAAAGAMAANHEQFSSSKPKKEKPASSKVTTPKVKRSASSDDGHLNEAVERTTPELTLGQGRESTINSFVLALSRRKNKDTDDSCSDQVIIEAAVSAVEHALQLEQNLITITRKRCAKGYLV